MAFGKGGALPLSAPRTLTLLLSLALVGVALLSLTSHLPAQLAMVRGHRFEVALAGYAVLLAGVLLRRF